MFDVLDSLLGEGLAGLSILDFGCGKGELVAYLDRRTRREGLRRGDGPDRSRRSTVFSRMSELQVEQYLHVSREAMEGVGARFQPDLVHGHHL